jgi:Fe-S-cluster containining protein
MQWFCLELHASYQCQHSGVCCSANWHIPTEPAVVRLVNERGLGLAAKGQPLFSHSPDDGEAIVARRKDGTCVFFDRDGDRLCDIHRAAGPEALPSACRHFPREVLVDRRGVFVSLSHFCPTAGALLLTSRPLRIVAAEPPLRINGPIEGLDASEALAPLVRPGLLSDLDGYAAWERRAIEILARPELTADEALDLIAAATEEVRDWRPADGLLAARVDEAFGHRVAGPFRSAMSYADLAAEHFPPASGPVADFDRLWDWLVEPSLLRLRGSMRNYLAARLFANWIAYQGQGLRTIVEWLRTCLAALKNEMARQAAASRRPLTGENLIAAAGAADWLLLHTVDSEALARHLGAVEGPGVRSRSSR